MANTASPPTPLISNRSNKNDRKRPWRDPSTRTQTLSDDDDVSNKVQTKSTSKFGNTHNISHESKKLEINMKSNINNKTTTTKTKKKNRFDSSSSSSSDDESFEVRKQRIALRKKISAKSHKYKKNVPPKTTDCCTSGNDTVAENMNRSALSHDENDEDDRSINRKVDTESHREDTQIDTQETKSKHACLEEDKEEVAVPSIKQKTMKDNSNIPCIDLLDSDDSGDPHPKMDSGSRKKRHKRKPKSRNDHVDSESLKQRSKHLVTKTGSVLSDGKSSDNAIYAGMDPASRALIQKLQQEDEAAKSTSKIMGENDRSLARRMHAAERAKSTNGYESISSMEDLLQSLDRCQRDALIAVERQARIRHEAAYPKVQKRITSLGYKHQDLDNCLSYIRNEAPIIIHLNEQCLSFLAAPGETHYRNLFEVNTSGGSPAHTPRRQWERSMFGSSYDRAKPFQRVKYGCLNFTGDIEGVSPARCYGQLFITLKQSVRHRCTFFNMDTAAFSGGGSGLSGLAPELSGIMGSYGASGAGRSHQKDTLATARNYCHILEKYSDAELHSILALNKIGGGQSKCMNYKEVQIHGPVCLATDVEALSIPGREVDASRDLMSKVERFQKKSNCTILWQADLLGHDSSRHRMAAGSMPYGLPPGPGMGMPPAPFGVGSSYGAAPSVVPFAGSGHALGGGGFGRGSTSMHGAPVFGSTSGHAVGGAYPSAAASFAGSGHVLGGTTGPSSGGFGSSSAAHGRGRGRGSAGSGFGRR